MTTSPALPSGKTTTMLGGSGSGDQLGIIPTAISWLYRGIGEQKQKSGARFSVRVSAVQIAGAAETLRDLLKDHAKGGESELREGRRGRGTEVGSEGYVSRNWARESGQRMWRMTM